MVPPEIGASWASQASKLGRWVVQDVMRGDANGSSKAESIVSINVMLCCHSIQKVGGLGTMPAHRRGKHVRTGSASWKTCCISVVRSEESSRFSHHTRTASDSTRYGATAADPVGQAKQARRSGCFVSRDTVPGGGTATLGHTPSTVASHGGAAKI